MLLPLFFFSCSTQQKWILQLTLQGEANEQVAVITSMDFARRDDNGAALGFNLDNHETDFGDNEGCGLQDISAPDGTPGIDNAFSGLLLLWNQHRQLRSTDLSRTLCEMGALFCFLNFPTSTTLKMTPAWILVFGEEKFTHDWNRWHRTGRTEFFFKKYS